MKKAPKDKEFNVVYLGESGFPVGFGAIQKLILVSKSLIKTGAKVTVINRKGTFSKDKPVELKPIGVFEGIHYQYTPGSIYRPEGFFERNWQKVIGILGEFKMIWQMHRKGELDAAIISCYHFGQVLLYRLYAYVFRFPVVYNYVEMASAIEHRRGIKKKINDFLFERLLVRSMNGALPISQVLVENYRRIAPGKPILKLPILCDFAKFDVPNKGTLKPGFLYCGALDYLEVINFVLEAYDQLPKDTEPGLILVLGGGEEKDKEALMEKIQEMEKAKKVQLFLNVPHNEIPFLYKQALALLIPMRPTLQDAARFPHKIGEYVASGNPMISINYGEVAHYFKDQETALIADSYDTEQFSLKMKYVIDNPLKAKEIGENGKQLGLKEFSYLNYGEKLKAFLKNLK